MKRFSLPLLGALLALQSGCVSSRTAVALPSKARVEVDSIRSARVLSAASGKVFFEVLGDERLLREQEINRATWIEVETEDGYKYGRSIPDIVGGGPTPSTPDDPPLMEVSVIREDGQQWFRVKDGQRSGGPVEPGRRYAIIACATYSKLVNDSRVSKDLRSEPFWVTIR